MSLNIVKTAFSCLASIGNWSGVQLDIKRLVVNKEGVVICDTRKRLAPGDSLASVLERAAGQGITLARCDLSGMNLEGVNLADADLTGASFANADLSDAILTSATLDHVDFTGAVMINARCSYASLEGADFTNAYLVDADLSYTDMTDAEIDTNHTNSNVLGCDFHGAIWDGWDPREFTPKKSIAGLS